MTIQQRLDERYGRIPRRSRRIAWIAGIALAALAVGWFGWSTMQTAAAEVDFDDLGYEVRSEHEVSVTFQITSGSRESVACALEALDEQFGVVGWRIVEYPPSDAVSASHTESIPTVAEATTGIVKSCWVP
ncbi:hypothetical protein GCM10017576_22100 [Microbacterium barkeri]|uniref:DUF4307 domain-containing protein n=1 Tax=Microbacterium barkeri TaxID=33917 RepID=A0A9W6LXD4_9MICO|nr:DUF4307 domain-containing protein [Microbacterium barkeri]MDR6876454.1 hypothetical protein [Microbacterium barkeri]GLJ62080.1 hypothetical protein GCM10017576_22100 [Microbacterium barkeri]